jgi:hypothetical protein
MATMTACLASSSGAHRFLPSERERFWLMRKSASGPYKTCASSYKKSSN